ERRSHQSHTRTDDRQGLPRGAREGKTLRHGHAHRRLYFGDRSRGRGNAGTRNISVRRTSLGLWSLDFDVSRKDLVQWAFELRWRTKYKARSTKDGFYGGYDYDLRKAD